MILVDTPGLSAGRRELGRRMGRGARDAVLSSDVVVWLEDSSRPGPDEEAEELLRRSGKPVVVALNKVDLVRPKERLLPRIDRWAAAPGVEVVVPISALRRDGVEALLAEVAARLPEGPPLYPEDMLTDRPERFLAGEIVREQVLRHCEQEVPHAVAVQVTSWREVEGAVRVEAIVLVDKESQKGILIGRGGSMVKRIGEAAREGIRELLGAREVHLRLRVAVSAGWRGDPRILDELGYGE